MMVKTYKKDGAEIRKTTGRPTEYRNGGKVIIGGWAGYSRTDRETAKAPTDFDWDFLRYWATY